jgi:hypothetical protein
LGLDQDDPRAAGERVPGAIRARHQRGPPSKKVTEAFVMDFTNTRVDATIRNARELDLLRTDH